MLDLNCSRKNFPLRAFFNEDSDEIMLFYRQGQSLRIHLCNLERYEFQDIIDSDLGQLVMYMEHNILLAQSSTKVIFFKL